MPPGKLQRPYGTWQSPLTPEDFAANGSVMLTELHVNKAHGKVYSLEIRADEDGKGVLVEHDINKHTARVCLDKQYNCTSQVCDIQSSPLLR
jgi:hypothetical protein